MANLKRAEYGKVDLDYVLGIGGFDLERFLSFILFFYFSFIRILQRTYRVGMCLCSPVPVIYFRRKEIINNLI
jgi:hypothetical protein